MRLLKFRACSGEAAAQSAGGVRRVYWLENYSIHLFVSFC